MTVTKRDRRVTEHLGHYYVSPISVLLAEFFDGLKRSTGETRLNQLVKKAGILTKSADPFLHYHLSPEGASLLEQVPPPPREVLDGDLEEAELGQHIAVSLYCFRTKRRLIRQHQAVKQIGEWVHHEDHTQRYVVDGEVTNCLCVSTSMRAKQVVERCIADARYRKKLHGDRFYSRLASGTYRWEIITPSPEKARAIIAAATRMGFPPGAPVEYSLRTFCVAELLQFLPRKKKQREHQHV